MEESQFSILEINPENLCKPDNDPEDVAEDQDVWEDLEDEDQDEENSYPEGFDLIDHLERRQLLEEQF